MQAVINAEHSRYDTIGNAGFGLDFGTLRGRRSAVIEGINSFKALQTSLIAIIQFALSLVAPAALKIPTPLWWCYNQLDIGLNNTVHEICEASRVEEHEGNPGFTGSSLIHQLRMSSIPDVECTVDYQ